MFFFRRRSFDSRRNFWNNFVENNEEHCTSSEGKGERQQRMGQLHEENAEKTGDDLHQSTQLSVPKTKEELSIEEDASPSSPTKML